MNLLDDLYARFKDMPRISVFTVKRYTKMNWDDCDEIYDELLDMRNRNGIIEATQLKEKTTRKSKFRRLQRISTT